MVKVISGILLLLGGGAIYLLQRSTQLLMFRLVDGLGLSETVGSLRLSSGTWPEFIVYNLPGGLWAASYVLLADALFCRQALSVRLMWVSLVPLIGVGSEVLQMVGLCPGTADWLDAVCYGLPYLVYVTCLNMK